MRNKDKQLLPCFETSAAEEFLNTARIKQDNVFTEFSTYQHPEDLFALEVR